MPSIKPKGAESTQGLSQYGVKTIDGVNKLSGPGLAASDQAGILMGGAKWPGRLMNKCGEMIGEYGEDGIMAAFERGFAKKHGAEALFEAFCKDSCSDEQYKAQVSRFTPSKEKEL